MVNSTVMGTATSTAASATHSATGAAATTPAGILAGGNPIAFNLSDPLPLFIIQVFIIIIFCQLLALPLKKLHQPRVIAEVLGGIILGPSVMGRIPGFNNIIFPSASLPFINLAANFGLVLFLFLVGLELDPRHLKKNVRASLSVAIAGMVLPFLAGIAVSYGLYKLQNTPNIPFSTFLIFTGVAVSITAFPVLARILAELKLLKTSVGAITMSAGLLNDCTAWVLLALVVALINASSGIVALYVFLLAILWTLILFFIVGPLFKKVCVATNSIESGPTPLTMSILLIIVLLSAFVTDMIGIHPVFGGFLAGVIVPHEKNFAIYVTEKIEDIINIIFLPLYFALSGLKTQIGLLNTGPVWGYVFLVIAVACAGKVIGCTIAARFTGMKWRESLTVGFLMNCKGLVELIVLNIGHDAGVINDQIFVIMVVMALVTTFMTTPVVLYLYPVYRRIEDDSDAEAAGTETPMERVLAYNNRDTFRLMVCLNRLQHVPSLMTLIQMLNIPKTIVRHTFKLEVHALRLVELTQRASAVMMAQADETLYQDPVVNVFRTFGLLNSIEVASSIVIAPLEEFSRNVREKAEDMETDMVLLPLDGHHVSAAAEKMHSFDHSDASDAELTSQNAQFVLGVLRHAKKFSVGLFLDRGFGLLPGTDVSLNDNTKDIKEKNIDVKNDSKSSDSTDIADQIPTTDEKSLTAAPTSIKSQRIFVLFFGGVDDREAVQFAFKLAKHPSVSLTVLRFTLPEGITPKSPEPLSLQVTPAPTLTPGEHQRTLSSPALYEGVYSHESTIGQGQSNLASDVFDVQVLDQLFNDAKSSALSQRVRLETISTEKPLHTAAERARKTLTTKDLVIVGRRPGNSWILQQELLDIFSETHSDEHLHRHKNISEMRKVFGDIAYGMLTTGVKSSLLVVQNRRS